MLRRLRWQAAHQAEPLDTRSPAGLITLGAICTEIDRSSSTLAAHRDCQGVAAFVVVMTDVAALPAPLDRGVLLNRRIETLPEIEVQDWAAITQPPAAPLPGAHPPAGDAHEILRV